VKKLRIVRLEVFELEQQNLFEKAKSMMTNFTSDNSNQTENTDVIKRAIQAAYSVASPEEKEELEQFERQLNELK